MTPIRSIAVCFAMLSVGLPAAADEKSIHAAICQPQYLSPGASIFYDEMGGVQANNGFIYVVCPLMRDRMNWGSATQTYTEMTIPSGGSVYCALYSQTEDGGAGGYVDVDSGSRSTAGVGAIGLSVTIGSGNEAAYGLWCSLTQNSVLHHIYTNENNNGTE